MLDNSQQNQARIFAAEGTGYPRATLVLFRDQVRSGCGAAQSAMGPFYCPADQKVCIDHGFHDELRRRLGAPGDFARAYVLTHEVGDHVQNMLGTERQLRRLQQQNLTPGTY